MASKSVIINNVTYSAVPSVQIPLSSGSGNATFTETSDATLTSGAQMLSGYTAYADGTLYTGSISSKAEATYTPTTSDQTIASGQYLSGAQTVKGDANLVSANILSGKSIFGVSGSLTLPSISQDSTTKVLTIS